MEKESSRKDTIAEKADNREYVYVRYDNDDEMNIYDIIDSLKKYLLLLKRHLAFLMIFVLLGGALGWLQGKHDASQTYTSSALLFVDLDREQYSRTNDINESSTISMLAKSFSQIVNSDSIMTPISEKYAVKKVDVTVPDGTQTIRVNVTADNAVDAMASCEALVNDGIDAITNATHYATITVVSPASKATQNSDDASSKTATMTATIFLLIALAIVAVRELAFAYNVHKVAKHNEEK